MSEDTNAGTAGEARKTPGKMRTVIGTWNHPTGEHSTFTVLADLGTDGTAKQIAKAVKALGVGAYKVLTFREVTKTYATKTVDVVR